MSYTLPRTLWNNSRDKTRCPRFIAPVKGHRNSHTSSKSYSWRPSSSTIAGAAKSKKPGGSGSRKHPSTQGWPTIGEPSPGPQPNGNNKNRGHNREEVSDSIMDARDIINARRRSQLAVNSDTSKLSAGSSTTSSTRRISSLRTTKSTMVSKILLNGYVYSRPLLVL